MTISGNYLTVLVAPAAQAQKDNKHGKQEGAPEKLADALQPIPRRREVKNAALDKINACDISQPELIGQGTFATVYKALYQKQAVAIKKVVTVEEFKAETNIVRQLSSPGSPYTPETIGIVETSNLLVTEYMAGGDLWHALERSVELDWVSRLKIAFDVSNALSYLHHKNLIHGDIKSHNVLLDANNNAKLTDFGLTHSEKSRESTGAYPWMAPELFFSDNHTTKASDIYSLGILFAELAYPTHSIVLRYQGSGASIRERHKISFDFDNGVIAAINNLEQCRLCPPAFASLIKDCIRSPKTERPPIHEVIERLVALLMLPDPFQQPTAIPIREMREALTPRAKRLSI